MEMKIMYDDAEEMSSSSSADVKLAKKAWIVPGQRIDYTFEIEMQAMSGEKLPFIVRATGLPVAPALTTTTTTSPATSTTTLSGASSSARPAHWWRP